MEIETDGRHTERETWGGGAEGGERIPSMEPDTGWEAGLHPMTPKS